MRIKTLEQKSAQELAGLQTDILAKLRNGNMTWDQIQWFKSLSFEQREELMINNPERKIFLETISKDETIVLDALDGKETLAGAKEIFSLHVDPNLTNWGTNKPCVATEENYVDVYVQVGVGTFSQIFGSLGADLNKLCMTQAQIKNFCKKHAQWLCLKDHATFFLFKVKEKFFVAAVYVRLNDLSVYVFRFDYKSVWHNKNNHFVVLKK